MVSCGSCATLDLMGQKPTYKYNVISHNTVLRQKNAKKRPDRKEDLATPSRKRSLGQLGNLSRSVARASQEPRAGHWALAGQDAHQGSLSGSFRRILLLRPWVLVPKVVVPYMVPCALVVVGGVVGDERWLWELRWFCGGRVRVDLWWLWP